MRASLPSCRQSHCAKRPEQWLTLCRLCQQLYYELAAEREKAGRRGEVALVRLEQLAPFPFDLVMRELRRYPNAEVMWCALQIPGCSACSHVLCCPAALSPVDGQNVIM
jgi:2-oxoglutarate dehydrogenase E1 component